MPAIDYRSLVDGIASTLKAYPALATAKVIKFPAEPPEPEALPAILIRFLERRYRPSDQRISAGRTLNLSLVFQLLAIDASLDSHEEAVFAALDLASLIDQAIMSDRSLGGVVPNRTTSLEGGPVQSLSARDGGPPAFAAMAETRIVLDVQASL